MRESGVFDVFGFDKILVTFHKQDPFTAEDMLTSLECRDLLAELEMADMWWMTLPTQCWDPRVVQNVYHALASSTRRSTDAYIRRGVSWANLS